MSGVHLLTFCRSANRLFRPKLFLSSCIRHTNATQRCVKTSASLSIVPTRGPFTPEEKLAESHMMSAPTHWKAERVVSIGLIALLPAAFFYQGPVMDFALSTTVLLHAHWGMESVVTDYFEKYIPWINKIWLIISMLTFGSVYYFNYNDVGVCKALKMLWSV